MIINDTSQCVQQERNLVIAIISLMAVAVFLSSFTDTFTSKNGQKYTVFLAPFYGPICFSLPSEEDKDHLYEFYFFKGRDLAHGFMATIAFTLISIFMNPVCMCLFPSHHNDGTSSFDSSIIRTIPIVVSLIIALMMICLGPPRQLIGFQNVPETAPLPTQNINRSMRADQENPVFLPRMSNNDVPLDPGMPQKERFYPSSELVASRDFIMASREGLIPQSPPIKELYARDDAMVASGVRDNGVASVYSSVPFTNSSISNSGAPRLTNLRQSQQRERLGAIVDGGAYHDKTALRQSRSSQGATSQQEET
eukprot:CAMPEP_0175073292 /NCGR_PEP_ID=MMETSP0052_2-20121109/20450_1 /TAXON_ID=51329 ORGANISM="Polytomella parva, Strain SAG 63-3" /NCGR_SAMPLE_ID=MMETSP0052_2 /ASSEMBLY_ACC=CAM_ASM_000194 /LENGTH=308 /DNA_ID=CAMNT_0016341023 /DNA_START=74 /DNA_END=1000 /DNA_ORIENTATION=+